MTVQWRRASTAGILHDDTADAFHAGRTVDVLPLLLGGVLAASETSGVWLIPHDGSAIALSHEWTNPNVTCLAAIAEGWVLAGCTGEPLPGVNELLYESGPQSLAAPWRPVPLPGSVRTVHEIAVVGQSRVVLACDDGIWWSSIPSRGEAWDWLPGLLANQLAGECWSVCSSADATVTVGLRWPNSAKGRAAILVGRWTSPIGGVLVLSAATTPPGTEALMGRTVVASSLSDGHLLVYALSIDPKTGLPNVLLRGTVDKDWAGFGALPARAFDAAGEATTLFDKAVVASNQFERDGSAGGFIHRLAVSPHDPAIVSFGGLVRSFLSTDAGTTWSPVGGWQPSPHLHPDVHVVRFDPYDAGRLVVASDGGVATSPDFGLTFHDANERFPSLQMLAPDGYRKAFYGRIGISGGAPQFVGAGLVDNGNVTIRTNDEADVWRALDGGDGGGCFFPGPVGLLRTNMNYATPWLSTWNGSSSTFQPFGDHGKVPQRSPDGTLVRDSLGKGAVCAEVVEPAFRVSGRLMYALAWESAGVYGLFANDDGTDPAWQQVAGFALGAGESVVNAASWDGVSVLAVVRTKIGFRSMLLGASAGWPDPDGRLGTVTSLGAPSDAISPGGVTDSSSISLVRAAGPTRYFATFRTAASGSAVEGYLLHTTDAGAAWSVLGRPDTITFPMSAALPSDVIYSVALASREGTVERIFACTSSGVYSSRDGRFWRHDSAGLPTMPQCSHLEVVPEGNGYRVFLATFGWSLWKTDLNDYSV